MLAKLRDIRPDLTVTVAFRGIHPMDAAQDTTSREGAAIGRMLAKVPGRRAIIVDTPYSDRDIPSCLDATRPTRRSASSRRRMCSVWVCGSVSGSLRTSRTPP